MISVRWFLPERVRSRCGGIQSIERGEWVTSNGDSLKEASIRQRAEPEEITPRGQYIQLQCG